MRHTDQDDPDSVECKSADTSGIMSMTSETGSREDSGCGSHDLFWGDDTFNTRRTSTQLSRRDHNPDNQTSETGSIHSDSSGSALLLNSSYHASHVSGPSSGLYNGPCTGSHEAGTRSTYTDGVYTANHVSGTGSSFANGSYTNSPAYGSGPPFHESSSSPVNGLRNAEFSGTSRSGMASPSHLPCNSGNLINGHIAQPQNEPHIRYQDIHRHYRQYFGSHNSNGLEAHWTRGESNAGQFSDTLRSSPRINLSKSFDQSLLIHAVRKQKALANYYELKENSIANNNNNNEKRDMPQSVHIVSRQCSLNDSTSDYPLHNMHKTSKDIGRYIGDSIKSSPVHGSMGSAPPVVPPRQCRPHSLTISPRSKLTMSAHPFYVPPAEQHTHTPDKLNTSVEWPEEEMGDYCNDRMLARAAFKTRALSADFGMAKIPDFPCHRAALGEGMSTTPTKDNPSVYNGLNQSWPNSAPVTPISDHAHRTSLVARFAIHSISESKKRVEKGHVQSEGYTSVAALKRSSTTASKARDESGLSLRSRLKRSSSAPNNLDQWTDDDDDEESHPSLGESLDDDDYGFRSHPGFKHMHVLLQNNGDICPNGHNDDPPTVTGMQKAKSPATPRRILPKKWRKSKNIANSTKHISLWRPEGGCLWSCKNGRQLMLSTISLMTLTEVERLALHKIALAKLKALDLGCAIHVPKDWNCNKRSKKSTFSSLRKRTASTSALENRSKEAKDTGWVFGIPLGKCIANDIELRGRKPPRLQERIESLHIPSHTVRQTRKSSTSSGGAVSSESPSESDLTQCLDTDDITSESQGSKLLDALSLSSTANLQSQGTDGSPLAAHIPQIPHVVTTCCKHLETYGLQVLGIFRIGSSKKRAKQLRDELDTGRDVKLNEEHNAHDVAALLKEYFRDLPDPLLTRDLYSAFVATRKIRNDEVRTSALQYLVSLLPGPNRDTLWAILRFLNLVVQHSADVMSDSGQLLPGNKMDSTNLATLFGPNLLHKAKSGEFQVESLERAEERKDVISVIKELVDKQSAIFQLNAGLQDDLYRLLQETNPEALDHILRHRSLTTHSRMETDHETTVSSFYDDSECSSSVPHSPGYSSENDSGCPRTFAEAMQLGAVPHVVPPGGLQSSQSSRLGHPDNKLFTSAPMLVTPQRSHKPAGRVASDDTQREHRKGEVTLKVPAGYRLSAPDQVGWYRGDRSVSPASPRISPSPKAMKTGTPEMRIRITKTDSPESSMHSSSNPGVSPHIHVRRSVGVPHGPGPGGHRSKSQHSKNTLVVPTVCSRSKSSESCSSLGSSSGYKAGSSRSGTNSPLTPDQLSATSSSSGTRWFLESPPDSPNDIESPSPLQRTSSTHRPLGFNVSKPSSTTSFSSSSSTSTLRLPTCSSPGGPPPTVHDIPTTCSMSSVSSSRRSSSGAVPHDVRPPLSSSHRDESMDWQKERWKHWESLTKQHSDDFHEQETLV